MQIYSEKLMKLRYDSGVKIVRGGSYMKKCLAAFLILAGISVSAKASELVLNSSAVVNSTISANQNFDLDLNRYLVDALSVQVNLSSAQFSALTFTDGQTSTGSITITTLSGLTSAYATENLTVTTNSTGTKASATITIISTTGLSGQTLTVNGYPFTEGQSWTGIGITTAAAATNLATLLRGSPYTGITATATLNVVYATATNAGTYANNLYSMSSSSPTVMRASATFTGGKDYANYQASITLNANGVATTLTEGKQWFQRDVASNTALSICVALNNNFSSLFLSTVQPNNTAIIYSTAVNWGASQNDWNMAVSTVALTLSKPNFANGLFNSTLTIGGYTFIANKTYFPVATSTGTAIRLMASISTIPVVSVSTTGSGTIIAATSTVVGRWTNFSLISSTPSALTVSGPFFARGADSDIIGSNYQNTNQGLGNYSYISPVYSTFTLNSIQKNTTSWAAALPVLFSSGVTGTQPSPLVGKTTYYVSNVSPTGFQLSDTSTGALAGLFLSITTGSAIGGGSFSLTPTALAGTPSFKFQSSNDGLNFSDVYVSTPPNTTLFNSSQTFASPYANTSFRFDIGSVYYRFLRFVYNAGQAGAVAVKWIVNGRKFAN